VTGTLTQINVLTAEFSQSAAMPMPKPSSTLAIVAALIAGPAWWNDASAAPQELRCVLADTAAHPGSENRPLTVVFDDAAATLNAEENNHSYSFGRVSISNVAINGQTDSVSLGIDRSSLGIVWQQYGTDNVVTEYGRCRRSDDTPATVVH